MILKVRCLVLILIFVPSLFADNSPTISKWQYYNEYAQKDNVFFYENYSYTDNHESKFSLYLKEFLYASGGSCVGCLGFIAAYFTMPASAAYGTRLAARKWSTDPEGNFLSSFLGAFCGLSVGGVLGVGIIKIFGLECKDEDDFRISGVPEFPNLLCITLIGIPAFLGNSIGAVIGYNLSIPKESGYGLLYRHFDPPSFSMKTEKTEEGKTITAVDFRLINARF